jgi:hypothetical protein
MAYVREKQTSQKSSNHVQNNRRYNSDTKVSSILKIQQYSAKQNKI